MSKLLSSRKNRGFSLLELIVGVAVLAIGIVTVMQALSFSARATAVSSDIIEAVFFAEDNWQELESNQELLGSDIPPKTQGKYIWKCTKVKEGDLPLLRLTCTLGWTRRGTQEEIVVKTFLREPKKQ